MFVFGLEFEVLGVVDGEEHGGGVGDVGVQGGEGFVEEGVGLHNRRL